MAKCIQCGRQIPAFTFRKLCQWCVQHEAAQRGESGEENLQRVIPAPWVRRESTITLTHVIFGANLAVFLAMVLTTRSIDDFPGMVEVRFGANYGPATLSGDWWRLLTYMFLHGGMFHIFFNMWCLWDLGAMCESLYGRWTYGAIYLITGIAAGLASVGWNPGVLSVGASGAIFGLAGALAASFYLGELSVPREALRCVLRSLAFFIGFNVLFGFGWNIFFGESMGGIDNAAHVGGLISGAILGAMIARLAPHYDAYMRRATVLGVVALAVLGAGWRVRQWRGPAMRAARAFEVLGENNADTIPRLRILAKQEPNSAPIHALLAEAYFNQQRFAEAEAEFRRVVELKPKSAEARYNLGVTYLNEKRPADARTVFSDMLAQGLSPSEAHYGLGLADAAEGKNDQAITEFKIATANGEHPTGIYFDMGRVYARQKMYDDAIAAYLQDKEKSGDYPELDNALADAYQAKGMTQQSREARNKAAQLAKQSGQTK